MNSRDLSHKQIDALRRRLAPIKSQLNRLHTRAVDVNLRPMELVESMRKAMLAMEELDREAIRAKIQHHHAPHDPLRKPSDRA